jgi:hypothetical protein
MGSCTLVLHGSAKIEQKKLGQTGSMQQMIVNLRAERIPYLLNDVASVVREPTDARLSPVDPSINTHYLSMKFCDYCVIKSNNFMGRYRLSH